MKTSYSISHSDLSHIVNSLKRFSNDLDRWIKNLESEGKKKQLKMAREGIEIDKLSDDKIFEFLLNEKEKVLLGYALADFLSYWEAWRDVVKNKNMTPVNESNFKNLDSQLEELKKLQKTIYNED